MHINDLLKIAAERRASDLHIKVGSHPVIRVDGELVPLVELKRLMQEDTIAMAFSIMSSRQKEKFKNNYEIDIAYSVPGLGRFRCNIFQQRGTVGMVLRVIPVKILSIRELMLPLILEKIAEERRGLILCTGTTGSGKSTTLAAMIDYINAHRTEHIMTVEDPIEFLHRDKKSIVNQREVEVDTKSFSQALRSALRQDPDVILVGEMRDYETIETALTAAETGHLVLSTLHTLDATETINRIISVFPPHQQKQIRLQLAAVLKAVVSLRLLPRADGLGRVPGDRSPDLDRVHPRLHREQGKDQADQGRHLPGHVAVRDADVRPVAVHALQEWPHHPRRGAAARVEPRRVPAQAAGHPVDLRRCARGDGLEALGQRPAGGSVLGGLALRFFEPGLICREWSGRPKRDAWTATRFPLSRRGESDLARSIEPRDVGEGQRSDIRDRASATPLTGSRETCVRDQRLSRRERKIARGPAAFFPQRGFGVIPERFYGMEMFALHQRE